jgi:cytochrome P450
LNRLEEVELGSDAVPPADSIEMVGFFQLLLVDGNETTTNLINNAMLSLIENIAKRQSVAANGRRLS